jgi:ATP-dependent Clp protease ATP-binding subunit ClpX
MTALFRIEGIELEFEEDALLAIAKIAKERKTNGRALRSVLETRLMKTQFKLPDLRKDGVKKIIVSASSINDGIEPVCYKGDEPICMGEVVLQI